MGAMKQMLIKLRLVMPARARARRSRIKARLRRRREHAVRRGRIAFRRDYRRYLS